MFDLRYYLLLDHLDLRERILVLVAASTGFRQSELFALNWGDIDFPLGTIYVTRSIAYGKTRPKLGPCNNAFH
jgi:integrase